jgi:hypothetical protein
MKRTTILISTIFISLFFSNATQARFARAFQYAAWEGLAFYRDENGAFGFCAIGGQYESGSTMYIALFPAGNWQILFFRPEGFSLGSNSFSLYADDLLIHTGDGTAAGDGRLLRIDIPLSAPVIKGLKYGKVLRVSSRYGNAYFSLSGTSGALAKLYHCVVSRRGGGAFGPGRAPGENTPGGQDDKGKTGASEPQILPREQLIAYATEVLQNAGLSNYRFLPQENGENASKAAVWQFEDGSLGSLIAISNAGGLDIDKFIGEMTALDTSNCKGNFANGKRSPRFFSGLEVRKVFASCSAGEKSFYVEYSLVRLPNGTLVKVMQANPGFASMPSGKNAEGGQSSRERATLTEEATLATFSKR